jgi:putative SOS response-associated peptidase YedK
MSEIHNLKKRMPLIIPHGDEIQWVDENTTINNLKEMMQPYDDQQITAYTISKLANSSKNNRNVPEIIQPIDITSDNQLSLF